MQLIRNTGKVQGMYCLQVPKPPEPMMNNIPSSLLEKMNMSQEVRTAAVELAYCQEGVAAH